MPDIALLEIKVPITPNLAVFKHTQSVKANSAVLEKLFPQLSNQSGKLTKFHKPLNKIDSYMLQETQKLISLIEEQCSRVNMPNNIEFNLYFDQMGWRSRGLINSGERITRGLNQDKWILDVSEWLTPNYNALACSQELVDFSISYAKNKRLALQEYKNLSTTTKGFESYIHVSVRNGLVDIKFYVESSLSRYLVKLN
ncbi:hypothetical protein [Paraglaciecola sp.]|uniref:hypothetical protein n=1 Tax=Paraglaciecola sp. TaxID=1920173 RepID=UPI003EF68D52